MPTLLDIGNDLMRLNGLLDASDGEITAEVSAEIDAALSDLGDKADGYAGLIRERELRADARESESKRMALLCTTDRNTAKALRDRLKFVMENTGQRKIETQRFKLSICNNGGKVPLDIHDPPEKLPEEYRKIEYKADTDAIRKALEAGQELPFAVLGTRGTNLRIT